MRSFFDWFQSRGRVLDEPWVILGKGPSFERRGEFEWTGRPTLGLNHVVREMRVTVAHVIDADVVDHCGSALLDNAEVVVLPWVPHQHNKPGPATLAELALSNPILRRLDEDDRLLWYNLSTTKRHRGFSPVVRVRYFSAEAALHLLAQAGARRIRSLGVDGGTRYGAAFRDLSLRTLLSNQRPSFDAQFAEIARTLFETGIDFAPLDQEHPIRIYVGATEAQEVPARVLEFSIRRHASMTVSVAPLHLAGRVIPWPGSTTQAPGTPFSFQRFAVPELAGRRGRAIYMDSDMLVFRDVRELWTEPFAGARVLAVRPAADNERAPFAVLVLDCESLDWDVDDIVRRLDRGELSYDGVLQRMEFEPRIHRSLDPSWNMLDRHPRQCSLLHYTDMSRQPWLCASHPLGYLWTRELFRAIDFGAISGALVREHVARGFLRPSLDAQLAERIEDTALLAETDLAKDRGWTAPAGVRPRSGENVCSRAVRGVAARMRDTYARSPFPEAVGRLRARLG